MWVSPLPQEAVVKVLILMSWACIGVLVYGRGVHVRRHRFTTFGEVYDVIDYYSFTNFQESKREIRQPGNNLIESGMYLYTKSKWLYFDLIRHLFVDIPSLKRGAGLVLGGGGGSVSLLLLRDVHFAQVDMVEVSGEMVQTARSWFLPKDVAGLKIYTQDAATFIEKTKNDYDFIFLDIFQGKDIDRSFFREQTMQMLRKRLHHGGVLIINFGPGFNGVVEKIQKKFRGMMFLTHRGSLVGIWPNQKYLQTVLSR